MAHPIVRLSDPRQSREYYMVWDTFFEQPRSIGMDLVTLGLFVKTDFRRIDGLLYHIIDLMSGGTSLKETSEHEFWENDPSEKEQLLATHCRDSRGYNKDFEAHLHNLSGLHLTDHAAFIETYEEIITSHELPFHHYAFYSAHQKEAKLVSLILEDQVLNERIVDRFMNDMKSEPDLISNCIASLDHAEYLLEPDGADPEDWLRIIENGGHNMIPLFAPNTFNRREWLACVAKNGFVLSKIPEYQDDEEFVLAAINSAGFRLDRGPGIILRHVGSQFLNDKNMMLRAVKNNGKAILYITDQLKLDHELVETAMDNQYRVFDELPQAIKQIPKFAELYEQRKDAQGELPF